MRNMLKQSVHNICYGRNKIQKRKREKKKQLTNVLYIHKYIIQKTSRYIKLIEIKNK